MEFKESKLGELCEIKIGRTPPRKEKEWFNTEEDCLKWVSIKDMGDCNKYICKTSETVSKKGIDKFNIPIIKKNTVILSFKLTIGRVAICNEDMISNEAIAQLPIKDITDLDYNYLYYYLKNYNYSELGNTSSIATAVNSKVLQDISVRYPSIDYQKKISHILSNIDKKIELNNKINNNLLEIITTLFNKTFTDISIYKRADEIANITIGKTPPRNLQECFSTNENDVKWVSISDLGKCGTYIYDTNEKLTNEAVEKYNVKVIPKDTIILSFKLTIGRIAITNEEMATNEAIAHFNIYDKAMKYYLYMYLKNFDYGKLGSTSSIATAVNSKIIKAMPIGIPNEITLMNYNEKVIPLFNQIKNNEMENITLIKLRDTLLPKFMKGEIDLDKIEI